MKPYAIICNEFRLHANSRLETQITGAMRPLARFAAAGCLMRRGEYVDRKPRRLIELAAARTVRVEATFALPAQDHCGAGFGWRERGGHGFSALNRMRPIRLSSIRYP